MQRLSDYGKLVAVLGLAVVMEPNVASAQIAGAVQYPPLSVGEDAQPPLPARIAPQTVSARRIELGVSGSSQLPGDYRYHIPLHNGAAGFTPRGFAPLGPSLAPPSAAGGG